MVLGWRLACGRPRPQGNDSTAKAGKSGLRGEASLAAKARHPMATNPVWVCQAGRNMLLLHFTLPFESRWFCRLPTPAPGRCCDPSQARMPARGFPPYPRMPRPPLRLTSCISLCGAACASRTLWWGWPAWLPRSCRCAGRPLHVLPSYRPAGAARLCA